MKNRLIQAHKVIFLSHAVNDANDNENDYLHTWTKLI